MKEIKKITIPFTLEQAKGLKAGDQVAITGTIYTARDAAHRNMLNELKEQGKLPIEIENQVIYYVGPAPAKPGKPIGSCGPTTSYRMDSFTPSLLDLGLRGMIGKGPRDKDVVDSMIKNGAVYFAAIGGGAASIANSVKKAELIAYPELGPEALRKLEVEDFPCVVAIDAEGNNLYELGVKEYRIED
ncbi:fumarate hydratase subunit beta [Desulfonispora thiosulfatigenes DSM 11270]|uniref:Fumarate hydratase subunit beta n=1 Tax=Desulfonispora thiosulfatigenes DSM 11270 TaxID=656914 RepID=A0A1W1V2N6_DESTI|nr:Fe-S-containing hydro-lyase [Desulfonispora thiosulfatigenes]SMB87593.1 fumarate hydratase subunit beta [Desulfonispora thiosulfatigenes DSM 11270]